MKEDEVDYRCQNHTYIIDRTTKSF